MGWIEKQIYGKGNEFVKQAFSALKNARRTAERIAKAVKETITKKDGFSGFTNRIKKAFQSSANDAKRIARTETTRVKNQARYDAGMRYKEETGDVVMKQWVCTFKNSRDSHIALHGVTIPMDEDFEAAGGPMAYPGDSSRVGPEEICNCRCYLIVGKGR